VGEATAQPSAARAQGLSGQPGGKEERQGGVQGDSSVFLVYRRGLKPLKGFKTQNGLTPHLQALHQGVSRLFGAHINAQHTSVAVPCRQARVFRFIQFLKKRL
jgi:hypothetical protein